MFAANPGFTAVAVLSLAIGIGATTSMFSLADAMLLRPLPVEHPGEMIQVGSTSPTVRFTAISYPDYLDLRTQAKTVSGLVASDPIAIGFGPDPKLPVQLKLGLAVSTNYFEVLGVRPSLGRAFRSQEDREPVVILSHSLWESQFGRDPSVIGRTVRLSKVDFTIIGVTPSTFPGLDRYVHESMYVPVGILPRLSLEATSLIEPRDRLIFTVYGRLAPGRTAAEAQAELKAIAANLERSYPATNRGRSVAAMPEIESRIQNDPTDALQTALVLTLSALVLLIACANVASLLLSRGRARAREIAIRLAIGAGRGRLLRQLLTESLMLAVLGGGAGLLLAVASIDFFSSLRLPTDLPAWLVARLDTRVLVFCSAASILSGLIFGMAPAFQSLRPDLNTTLKAGEAAIDGKRRRFHMRNILVAGQVGLSMTLLVIAGLLVKDFANLMRFNPGFRTDHMLVMVLDPAMVRYQEGQARAFYRQLTDRVLALPGVRAVALGQHVPLGFTGSSLSAEIEGYQMPANERALSIAYNTVDEHYFSTMQIPLVSGRAFDQNDTTSSRLVAIVNEAMARQYWPKRSAIGGRVKVGGQTLEVIGIAKDIKYRDIAEARRPFLYLPFSQQYRSRMTLHVETSGDPASMAAPVLAEIRRLDSGQPVQEVQTLQHFFEEGALFGNRLIMQLVTVIGLLGLLLAIAGQYGVVSYSVSRQTREIGIRMAVGAGAGDVGRMVLRQGMLLTLAGLLIGGGLAALASSAVATLLVGVSALDPVVYVLIGLLLCTVSLLACYVPARRASRIDPLQALRQE
jgi:predicted permease